ncbi:MAG: diguanylate cyclase [Rubrivivax sp.]|nr:diguanylate cyclase [Rubrivivax sp.]
MSAELLPSLPAIDALLARMLPALLAQHGDMLAVKDLADGRYSHVSASMAAFLGRPASEVVGHTDADLFDAAVSTALRAADQTAMAQTEPLRSEHRLEWAGARHDCSVLRLVSPADGEGPRWLLCVWTDEAPAQQRSAQLRSALEQLEQQQRANELLRRELADQALRDSASGLYTRAHFEDQLRREVDLSTREHREFAIVLIELDPPSERVREFGTPAQARILDAMGRLLRGGTRAMDASCRLDDKRFAVLLSGVGLATAHSRMEGLRRQCATQIVVLDGQELGFSVAMGVASFPHTSQTQDELLAACDAALAEAQLRGGNHVTLAAIRFEPG